MTPADYAAAIAKALEAGPTEGPWSAAGPSFGDPLPRYCNEVIVDNEDSEEDGETVCRPSSIQMDDASTADMVYIAACHPEALRSLLDEREALRKDAERYRWLRNESWGGAYIGKRGFPSVVEFKPGFLPSFAIVLAEDAVDAAIDAALAANKEHG